MKCYVIRNTLKDLGRKLPGAGIPHRITLQNILNEALTA
jgi:hypothetical protein